jgi:hypothetical protein
MRRIALTAAAVLVIALTALPGTTLAAAAGTTGPYSIPQADCNVGNGWRDVYAPVPTILASNRTAGAGNDLQAVYYWVRVYDYATGTVLTDWAYGGAAWANDNTAAALPALGTFGGHRYGAKWHLTGAVVRLQYFLQWTTPAGASLGTTDPVIVRYLTWIAGTNATTGTTYAC